MNVIVGLLMTLDDGIRVPNSISFYFYYLIKNKLHDFDALLIVKRLAVNLDN